MPLVQLSVSCRKKKLQDNANRIHHNGVSAISLGSKTCVFTPEQEQELSRHLLDLESHFYGLSISDVCVLAYEMAVKNNIEHHFRNPNLSFRKPEAT